MAVVVARRVDPSIPLEPPDYPDENTKKFQLKVYGRLFPWPEWWKMRADRMASDASEILAYDDDGTLTF